MIDEKAFMRGAYDILQHMRDAYATALDGIPDEDVCSWKPAAEANGGGTMNTFGTLGMHLARSATWVTFRYIYGDDEVSRDRDAEFAADATRDEALAEMDAYLAKLRSTIEQRNVPDLSERPDPPAHALQEWDKLRWMLHMLDHWGMHVGDAQIQRQLWEAERRGTP